MKHKIQTDPSSKRAVGRRIWNLLAKLPLSVRGPLIRRLFSVEETMPANLIFKKAETPKEIEQAFNVAYEGYHERKLVEDSESRLRVTKFHALPTTSILIAKENDVVIATITIVVDSALGLPLEKLWGMNDLRKTSRRIAEISTLSIRKDHRSRRGKLLLPLMGYMYRYCIDVLGVDKIVASVHPEVADFYRCVLLFKMFKEIKTYDFVQGAAAVAGWLDLTAAPSNYKKVYGNKSPSKNLHQFFIVRPNPPNYIFEERKYKGCSDFSFSPAQLEYFFKNKTEVMKQFSPRERNIIANMYFHPEFTAIINANAEVITSVERQQARFAVFYELQLKLPKLGQTVIGNVLDVSREGLRIHISSTLALELHEQVELKIYLDDGEAVPLAATVSWMQNSMGQIGLKLNHFVPKPWHDLITHFEQELVAKIGATEPLRKASGE